MHPFLTIADRAARLAGKRVVDALKRLDRLRIYEKKSHGFVTEIDYEVEQLLISHIREAYPKHGILSEETGHLPGQDDYMWIIDPLDGTTNFIHGLPGFVISIAVQYKNCLEQALIYDPLAQETFYASRGQGARLYQRRLRVSQRIHLKDALIYINRPPLDLPQLTHWVNMVKSLVGEAVGIRHLGSAALGLAYVAAGRLDGFFSSTILQPWDIAAGALLVQEAGGIICDVHGTDRYLETGKVIAANPRLSEYLLKLSETAKVT